MCGPDKKGRISDCVISYFIEFTNDVEQTQRNRSHAPRARATRSVMRVMKNGFLSIEIESQIYDKTKLLLCFLAFAENSLVSLLRRSKSYLYTFELLLLFQITYEWMHLDTSKYHTEEGISRSIVPGEKKKKLKILNNDYGTG